MKRRMRFERTGHLALDPQAFGFFFLEPPANEEPFEDVGGVAVVSICGPMSHHEEWFFDSYDAVKDRVRAAFESPCKAVVLKIDSPGGDVSGCFETAREIRGLADSTGKPLYAYADGCAASAAYALASAADGIWLPETARVGSIGVITMAVDQTAMDRAFGLNFSVISSGRRKADGNPHVPISEAAIAAFQGQVDDLAEIFFLHVSERRALPVDAVRSQEAAVFVGARAIEAGLADRVGTFDELLAAVASGETESRQRAKEDETMKFEEVLAALRKAAEGDDEDAGKAKKMLDAYDDKAEGEDDEKKDDDKAEGEDDEKKDDDKAEGEDDEKKDDKAAAATTDVALAAQVHAMSKTIAALSQEKADRERRELLASRPDLAPELVGVLTKKDKSGAFITPIATVRDICKGVPKSPSKKDPAAALKAQPTLGAGQSGTGGVGGGVTRASPEADELDRAFGLVTQSPAIRREGGKVTFGAMTPDEARQHLESKKKAG